MQLERRVPLRRCRLADACHNLGTVGILELLLACRDRIELDFSTVDWERSLNVLAGKGCLRTTEDGRWVAWMPSGTSLLQLCVLTELPGTGMTEDTCSQGGSLELPPASPTFRTHPSRVRT